MSVRKSERKSLSDSFSDLVSFTVEGKLKGGVLSWSSPSPPSRIYTASGVTVPSGFVFRDFRILGPVIPLHPSSHLFVIHDSVSSPFTEVPEEEGEVLFLQRRLPGPISPKVFLRRPDPYVGTYCRTDRSRLRNCQ